VKNACTAGPRVSPVSRLKNLACLRPPVLESKGTATGTRPPASETDGKRCPVLLLALALALLSAGLHAQEPPAAETIRFMAVDIFVDAKDKPLAAYQLEFTAKAGDVKIVGIEGGEHAAFAEAPFYDPKAMQHERVIIAAFSTEPATRLPTGKTRVATIHVQVSGQTAGNYELKLEAAGGADGNRIAATADSKERKTQ
jgi:hypothetical protein